MSDHYIITPLNNLYISHPVPHHLLSCGPSGTPTAFFACAALMMMCLFVLPAQNCVYLTDLGDKIGKTHGVVYVSTNTGRTWKELKDFAADVSFPLSLKLLVYFHCPVLYCIA